MSIPKSIIALHAAALIGFVPLIVIASTTLPATATAAPRLIGFGCEAVEGGPAIHTLLAVEEDQFPSTCREIVSLEEGCDIAITDADVELLATECRDYWGDGW